MKVPTITNYLSLGGLFNPEMMDHDKVRDMLMEIRDALMEARETSGKGQINGEPTWHLTAASTKRLNDLIGLP